MTALAAWAGLALSVLTATYLAIAWIVVNRAVRQPEPGEERQDLLQFLTPQSGGPDYTGMPGTEQCLCGCTLFHAAVSFQDKEIAYYILEGICFQCGAKVSLPYVEQDEEADL
jgi:hypothetical protein